MTGEVQCLQHKRRKILVDLANDMNREPVTISYRPTDCVFRRLSDPPLFVYIKL